MTRSGRRTGQQAGLAQQYRAGLLRLRPQPLFLRAPFPLAFGLPSGHPLPRFRSPAIPFLPQFPAAGLRRGVAGNGLRLRDQGFGVISGDGHARLSGQCDTLLRVVSERGVYVITERGKHVLSTHPERVDNKVLEQFAEFLEFKSRRREKGEPVGTHGEPQAASVASLSPTEAITRLLSDADDAVAAELLDRVLAQPPAFLERLSLRLLQAMGYGGKEALLTHTGKPGDAGLDGIVRQDALGLDLVGVQAKRYDRDSAVQRPEMQAFAGALQGAQTSRGVFVTTGRFSNGARQFAEQVPLRLVLIDGTELTRLMVRYDVGVTVKETYQLKSVDDDFFDDGEL